MEVLRLSMEKLGDPTERWNPAEHTIEVVPGYAVVYPPSMEYKWVSWFILWLWKPGMVPQYVLKGGDDFWMGYFGSQVTVGEIDPARLARTSPHMYVPTNQMCAHLGITTIDSLACAFTVSDLEREHARVRSFRDADGDEPVSPTGMMCCTFPAEQASHAARWGPLP